MTPADGNNRKSRSRPPVFVLGITGRSGTNYLRDLIALHPDCQKVRAPIWEDFFLDEARPLVEFSESVRRRWKRWDHDGIGAELLSYLGLGLLTFLSEGVEGRLVTKTPSVRNLDHFFDLFPEAYLVVIVRDPRSVAYSASASFGADYEGWARDWARAAATIASFQGKHHDHRDRFTVVRYEDLITLGRPAIEELLRFLELPESVYPFDEAVSLPPRGSSYLAAQGEMHWLPTNEIEDFHPLRRWEDWPRDKIDRIQWLTSPHLEHFGYEKIEIRGNSVLHRMRDAALIARLALRHVRPK